MGRLDGKVAVITGAGGGLGREMALTFAREGAAVVCQDLREDAASAAAEAVGGSSVPWACDVADAAAIEAMFDEATARLGVVNTPGDGGPDVLGMDQLLGMTDAAWRTMLDVHATGAFFCTRAMVRRLLEAGRGGSIVCTASISALSGVGPIHYTAAKAAVIGFVRTIAFWGGPHGIRANAICPGMIRTPMTEGRPADEEFIRRRTPLKRIGTPDDVAPLAVYLASDESSFVTAQTISPNGGIIAT
jgi:NAD(P)-dependent dehydrogenase (short-subunit alcohol dehydrogenase family)